MRNYHKRNSAQLKSAEIDDFLSCSACITHDSCGIILSNNNNKNNKLLAVKKTKPQTNCVYRYIPANIYDRNDLSAAQKRTLLTLHTRAFHYEIDILDAYKYRYNKPTATKVTRDFKAHIKLLAEKNDLTINWMGRITVNKPNQSYRISSEEINRYTASELYVYIFCKIDKAHQSYSFMQAAEKLGVSPNLVSKVWHNTPSQYKDIIAYNKHLPCYGKMVKIKSKFHLHIGLLKKCNGISLKSPANYTHVYKHVYKPVDSYAEKSGVYKDIIFLKKNIKIFSLSTSSGDFLIKNIKEKGSLTMKIFVRRTTEQMLCSEDADEVIDGLKKVHICDEDRILLAFERIKKARFKQKQPIFTSPQAAIKYYTFALKDYLRPEITNGDITNGDVSKIDLSNENRKNVSKDLKSERLSIAKIIESEELIGALKHNLFKFHGQDIEIKFIVKWLKNFSKTTKTIDLETGMNRIVDLISANHKKKTARSPVNLNPMETVVPASLPKVPAVRLPEVPHMGRVNYISSEDNLAYEDDGFTPKKNEPKLFGSILEGMLKNINLTNGKA